MGSPTQPRDERGRWTNGAGDVPQQTLSQVHQLDTYKVAPVRMTRAAHEMANLHRDVDRRGSSGGGAQAMGEAGKRHI